MKSSKEERLKFLLKMVAPDKPLPDFTELVMKEIKAESMDEVGVNVELGELIRANALETPAHDLVHNVMAQIKSPTPELEPIISKRMWRLIGALVLCLFAYIGFSDQQAVSSDGLTPYLVNIGSTLSEVLTKMNAVSTLHLTIVSSLCLLLLIDYLLRGKRNLLKRV